MKALKKKSRRDSWANQISGLGAVGKDKRLGATFCADLITQETAEEMWRGDDIIARAIETIPAEALREGFCVKIEGDKETSEAVDGVHRELRTEEHLQEALEYGRAYGGGPLLLGVDDGVKDLAKPLNEKAVRSLKFLTSWTPRELYPVSYYSDPLADKFAEIMMYRLVPSVAPPSAPNQTQQPNLFQQPLIHESRLIRVNGVRTSRRMRWVTATPGWDDSILVRIVQVVRDFQQAWQGSAILMQDFSTPVLKMKNLARVLAGQNVSGQTIAQRAAALELCRSIARVLIVDQDEEYKRETTPVTGLAELLDKLMYRVAAAVGMPVSLLFGQAPAGLNATGDSDIRWFYDQIKGFQRRRVEPMLRRITRQIFLSKDGPTRGKEPENWRIAFNPLWQLTDKEKAEARYIQAQSDQIYLVNQVISPVEIAQARFGGDEYSFETQLDEDAQKLREEMLGNPDLMTEQLGGNALEDKQRQQELEQKKAENPAPIAAGGAKVPPK
jgi:phage-related protein (TIGR01555 family)